jgi:sodium-dependent dicarboxylate transporter 2/3/5
MGSSVTRDTATTTTSAEPIDTDESAQPARPRIGFLEAVRRSDWNKNAWLLVGIVLFSVVYLAPPFSDAIDPQGNSFSLTHEGKAALALFLLAATWWVSSASFRFSS